MEKENQPPVQLTAPELASIWTQYMFETMNKCFFEYALNHLEDQEIQSTLKTALDTTNKHILALKQFFQDEKHPIPQGFTEKDVNKEAPRLFQDAFYLNYLYIMTLHGLTAYGLAVGNSIRQDLRTYFINCSKETMEIFDVVTNLMLEKGLFVRPPVLSPKEFVTLADKQSFLSGWFWERRPMTAMEIGESFFNMNKMHLHIALKVGFSQVTESKELKKIIKRGEQISTKHVEIFESLFREEKLLSPKSWQSYITESTTSPFSDKLIMYMIQYSSQAAIAFYGTALSVTARRDIGLHYTRLITELMKYAEDCSNYMIEKGWLEEPPMATDRQELSKKKKE
ncbi:DUF3231 family protein [Salirhabdus sp. Marseille-P4669]|uniref:DUF3231 family protein n=1 Tax=Salirhabdus sp. Marseille-P4669 TaxID=2042310 RepID=UPI000C795B6B|nr:DUF3231 family protein [Salirhabdus sp. Marseille-P4669]